MASRDIGRRCRRKDASAEDSVGGQQADIEEARAVAAMFVAPERVDNELKVSFQAICELCAGPMASPIRAVAGRLLSKRTLNRAQCADLWAELRPDVGLRVQEVPVPAR